MLEPPEDCEMNEMTLPSRDRIRNSILGRARYLSVTEARPSDIRQTYIHFIDSTKKVTIGYTCQNRLE